MKRAICLILIISSWARAQITPGTGKPYIQSSTARIATTDPADLSDPTKGTTTIQYMDGMGRAMQQVSYRSSPGMLDMVSGITELDALGRPRYGYLPVQSAGQNGAYTGNYASLAQSFYNDTAPYSEVDSYDASPLSSPVKSIAPGQAYRAGSPKGVVQDYETAGAGIRKYVIQAGGTIEGTQTYSNGDLLKATLIDEDGNTSIEYTGGKSGRLLLVQQKDRTGSTYLNTAYIYDFMGRLRYVVPPKAFSAQNSFTEGSSYFDEGIYATHYDGRGRTVESHVPGGGWTYTVYNELDQPVMSQDARQRESNLWTWIKYDGHGRPVMSGTYNSTASRTTLQNAFLSFTANEQFEERSTASGNLYGHTNKSFPTSISLTAGDVCKVNYYDDYNWVNNTALNYQAYKSSQWTNVKGRATGNLVKNLGNGQLLKSVMYYDDRGRVIQTHTQNRFGGINQSDFVYNFPGELLEERTVYRKPGQADLELKTTYEYDHVGRVLGATHYLNGRATPLAQYVHDEIGRLKQKNLMAAAHDIITENSPQPDGDRDLANRYVLLEPGTVSAANGTYLAQVMPSALQKIDYSYDIRGQLRGINTDASGNISLQDGDVFGMKLDHFETAQTYNGKVARQSWQTASGARSYTYSYDGYDRLSAAAYSGQGAENYGVGGIGYDANGNISGLNRNGYNGSGWGQIDNLSYTYANAGYGNRLLGVRDFANTTAGQKDNGSSSDYTYWPDGSLKSDANKGITQIDYNFLGLPEKIHFGASIRIENIYDAEGLLLYRKFINGGTVTQTDYMGGLIYENGILQSILHDEGRIKVDGGNLNSIHYQFFITDHLGNTRAIVERASSTTALVQETHYYPFGAVMEGVGIDGGWKFLYQSKESLTFNGANLYDFNTRSYDAYLGRFLQLDGANQFASGYVGMGNMPTVGVDPDGQWVHIVAGAVVGGVFNLGVKLIQGDIHSFKDGAVAFGIGAAAGAVTAATGGAAAGAFGLSSSGALTGIVTGGVGALAGDPIRGLGNAAYFGDQYTLKDYGIGVASGAILGGVTGAIGAARNRTNWWNGAPRGNGLPTFSSPKVNNEAIAAEGWVKGPKGAWINNSAPSGYGIGGNASSQFPDWVDDLGNTHKGGTYTITNNNVVQITKSTFGHTFTNHGANATNFIMNRARGSGIPSGQFLDDQVAARFILDNLGKTAQGAVSVPIPQGFPARMVMPDGAFRAATHVRIVPSGTGVKTAYPELIKR
ncbi:DUF6443 domain-containing protein [Marinilongibacter aquaticus]|uniref:DUF6443 domain-containing protein n=1 Tax=Marinilongibacter aquaticus TaxID=2975157 RepID=UPI0021BD0C41|nr:DUF6443 domain-containing protein [Marinilongibacter aquaticus]UBM60822.1 DUF6443 domain-containing protein [Marinilongibacter aquaticus]